MQDYCCQITIFNLFSAYKAHAPITVKKSTCGVIRVYRDMSINTILGTLLSHENAYIEKFGEQIELDIDDMIENLIQLFETKK